MLNILKRPRESLGSENGSQLSQPDCSPHRQAMLECSPGAGGKRLRAQSSGDAMSTPTSQFLAAVDSGERPTPATPALDPGAARDIGRHGSSGSFDYDADLSNGSLSRSSSQSSLGSAAPTFSFVGD